jgi:methyl-accepting chemotaxis protein
MTEKHVEDRGKRSTGTNGSHYPPGAASHADRAVLLDAMPVPALVCDAELRILHANPAATTFVTELEEDVALELFGVAGAEFPEGGSVGTLHAEPRKLRKFLSDKRAATLRGKIQVADQELIVTFNRVEGENTFVVSWASESDKDTKSRAAGREREMLEKSPTNVIFADADGIIRYMNQASRTTLKGLEQYLPVRVEEMIDRSFDVFHKNPAHQRRIVSDPKNLPHRTVISVGPEKLDLLVSAIEAADGKYLGAMLTWEVVTDKVRLQAEMARVSNMMENSPTNVMFADPEGTIRYMNRASRETLLTLENHLPCRVDEIVGRSFDVFHKNPSHQRRIVADPKRLPHRAVISVGPEKLDLLVSAIHDQENRYLGAMATWEVVTKRLALESEMARVSTMMENSPIAVIFADPQGIIRYLNRASRDTLRSLESHLPCRVDDMLNRSFDVFHKNPSHQRRIVSDPSNLPHRAVISVGPEKLDLLVSAISDAQSNYLGAMLTWSIVTKKLELEQSVRTSAQTLGASARDLSDSSSTMLDSANQTAAHANSVAAASEEVSTNIQTVASAVEEMSASIKEIARNAAEAAQVATQAVSSAERTNHTVMKLGESSADIGKVIKVITSIAQQTNLKGNRGYWTEDRGDPDRH